MEKVRKYLQEGETEKAIEQLLQLQGLDRNITDQILHLSGQYHRWKVMNRVGIPDPVALNRINWSIIELLGEIESPVVESVVVRSDPPENGNAGAPKENETETPAVPEMGPIDFNVMEGNGVELLYHSRYWNRKDWIRVPKDITLAELLQAMIDHYRLLEVLAPFEDYHKVEWKLFVNYREVKERDVTVEDFGMKNGDNIRIKAVFTKYRIKVVDGEPLPEVEIEDTVESEAEPEEGDGEEA